jgi:hypothetical protein
MKSLARMCRTGPREKEGRGLRRGRTGTRHCSALPVSQIPSDLLNMGLWRKEILITSGFVVTISVDI